MIEIIEFPTGGLGLKIDFKTYFKLFNFKTKQFEIFENKKRESLFPREFRCHSFAKVLRVSAELNNRFKDPIGEENKPF